MTTRPRLGPAQLDALREIGNIGAGTAATALSQMTGRRVPMGVPTVALLPVEEIALAIGEGDAVVAAMLIGVRGDAPGQMLLVMTEPAARALVATLVGVTAGPPGAAAAFTEMELSALQEVGNIMTGSYLGALAQITGLRLEPTPPAVGVDGRPARRRPGGGGDGLGHGAQPGHVLRRGRRAVGRRRPLHPHLRGPRGRPRSARPGRVSTAPAGTAPGLSAGIGQIVVSADPGSVISALGLGSCIGVVVADRRARVAGMAHVMLPGAPAASAAPPGKFADMAVPALVEAVLALGAERRRLVATIAGGAQMFAAGSGGGMLTIGGGRSGRTMRVHVGTGAVTVRVVGGRPVAL